MASYVDSNLMAQEKVLHRAHVSLWSLAPMLLLGVLLLIVVVGLFILIAAWIRYRTTEFAVTDRRIIAKTGLVSRRTVEMFLDKVESLNVEADGRRQDFRLRHGDDPRHGRDVGDVRQHLGPLALRKHFMEAADLYRRKI